MYKYKILKIITLDEYLKYLHTTTDHKSHSEKRRNRLRRIIFTKFGFNCKCCTSTGVEVILTESAQGQHWKVISIDCNGHEDILTIDHIIPLAKGGSYYSQDNLQPLCNKCNCKKGHKLINRKEQHAN